MLKDIIIKYKFGIIIASAIIIIAVSLASIYSVNQENGEQNWFKIVNYEHYDQFTGVQISYIDKRTILIDSMMSPNYILVKLPLLPFGRIEMNCPTLLNSAFYDQRVLNIIKSFTDLNVEGLTVENNGNVEVAVKSSAHKRRVVYVKINNTDSILPIFLKELKPITKWEYAIRNNLD